MDERRLGIGWPRAALPLLIAVAVLLGGCAAVRPTSVVPADAASRATTAALPKVPLKTYLRDKRRAADAGYDVVRLLFKAPQPFDEKVTVLTARADRFARLIGRLARYRVDDLRGEAQRRLIARVGPRAAARLREHLHAAARGDRSAEERTRRFVRHTVRPILSRASHAPPPLRPRPRPGVPVEPGAISGRIAFVQSISGSPEVHAMAADGSGVTNLSRNARFGPGTGIRGGISYSPDGTRIAFDTARDHRPAARGEPSTEIYVMAADGTEQRRLTSNATDDFGPTWSPDGGRIAFVRAIPGGWDLYVMNADGSGQRPLVATPALETTPAWSPDGSRIAFARFTFERGAPRGSLILLDLATGVETVLLGGPGFVINSAWSPDGRRLTFASTRDGFGESCFHDCTPNAEIYVMDAAGGGLTRLTRNLAQDIDPAFSPDGALIAWSSDRDHPTEDFEIYVMNAAGTCPRRVADLDGWDRSPAWQPSPSPTGAPLSC